MLRSLFRSSRSVRVPLKNGPVDLQRVTITRSSKSSPVLYRLFTTVAVTYFVARTINYVYPESAHGAISPTEVDKNAQRPADRPKSWQEHWKGAKPVAPTESEVIHFMLPIWIRQRKPEPWQPDDPTWQSFQAFSNDPKRIKEVVATIEKPLMKVILAKFGTVMVDLGTTEADGRHRVNCRRTWRMAPPLYAPASYEVPCFFVEPEKTSFGWRQLPNSIGGKMDRVFHPIVLAKAFYHGVEEFTWASYLITKARLMDQYNSLTGDEKSSSTSQKVLTEDEKAQKRLTFGRISEKNKDSYLPFLRGEYGEHESRQPYRDLVKFMTYKGAIESGCAVFRAHWIQGQEKSMQSSNRDGVILRGDITFSGERGTLIIHAAAVYSPETNSLIGQPIIKDAYLSPKMDKWLEREKPKATVKGALPQVEGKPDTEVASQTGLKPRPEQDEPPTTGKASPEEDQEESREK
ncbi:hypothetical protein H2200_005353 [Cladophialophora chaetospira]|uniref:Uncharacterized protein n=1 Tax=Cladophialophora chaetospira TaxID=386627 RepID=A0AA39CJR6_9EURO|nr:hypothetical protein H2200_005353 [Cladophialophora chaetospira]